MKRSRFLLIGVLIAFVVCIGGAAAFVLILATLNQRGQAEMAALGTWPDAGHPPADLIAVDLSHLGLRMGEVRRARDDEAYARPDWLYQEGSVIDYFSDTTRAVSLWALKYPAQAEALDDFNGLVGFAAQTCGSEMHAGGVILCSYNDASRKVFWHDIWIVDMVAFEGVAIPHGKLVDRVRDAVAAHWRKLATR